MKKKYNSKYIRNILEGVVLSAQLYLTKNGRIWDPEAEEFINYLNGFTKYCYPFRCDDWKKNIREIIYSPKVPRPGVEITDELKEYLDMDKTIIINAIYHFIDAAEVMEVYAKTHSWDEVEKTVNNQGHSGLTFGALRNILLDYALMGTEFADRFSPHSVDVDENFRKAYLERKEYLDQIKKLTSILNDEVTRKLKK